MPTTEIEKNQSETKPTTSPDRPREIIANLMNVDAKSATPETVEELLKLSDNNEQWIIDMVNMAAEDAMKDIRLSAGGVDVLDPEGTAARHEELDRVTQATLAELRGLPPETKVTLPLTATEVRDAIAAAKTQPTAEHISRLSTMRDLIDDEIETTVDATDRSLLKEDLRAPISKTLANIPRAEEAKNSKAT